jgi:TPR repeat protein
MAQRLAALLDQPPKSPQGVAANSIKGIDQRYARAWNYDTGKGVRADPAEAAYWYALAAADGDGRALTNLGTLLTRGWAGSKPDPASAALLWQAAAAHGEAIAMYDLGVLYERGIGTAADPTQAREWYQRAADHNHPDARAALKRLAG